MEYKIKSSAFNGKQEDWNRWSKKFVARAGLMGYKSVLLGVEERPVEENVKDLEEYIKNNDMAFADLMMACEDDVCFDLIDNARTEELPDGDARLAWVELRAKFEPSTTMSLIELKREFTLCCLTDSSSDPDIWIRELERIRRRLVSLGHLISDVDLTIHILNNLPEDYENLIENLESDIETGNLDLDKLKSRLRAKYRRLMEKEDKPTKRNVKVDKVLISKESGGFKGSCRICGEYGHKAAYCKKKAARKDIVCTYCKLKGHVEKNCWRKQKNEKAQKADKKSTQEVLIVSEEDLKNDDIWIGDTGATSHMTNNLEGLFDVEDIDQCIIMGDGKKLQATKRGKLSVSTIDINGKEVGFVMSEVKFVEGLWRKLFSISTVLRKGAKIVSDGNDLVLSKGELSFKFKEIDSGGLIGVKLNVDTDAALVTGLPQVKVDVNVLHKRLGHPCEMVTKETGVLLGLHVTGKMEACTECVMAKAKQKGLKKTSSNKSIIPGERLGFDISYLRNPSFGGSKYWLLFVDECTSMKWSLFLRRKTDAIRAVVSFVKDLQAGNPDMVKFLRCDNSGENESIRKTFEKEGVKVQMEFTAPNTPQENGKVERAFATLWGRTRAMLNNACFDEEHRQGLWTECARCATMLSNLLSKNGSSPYERFYGKKANFGRGLRVFGEVCVKSNRKSHKEKLKNRGDVGIFVGYPEDHHFDAYRIFMGDTKKIVESRDVVWLNKSFSVFFNKKGVKNVTPVEEEDSDDELVMTRLVSDMKLKETSVEVEDVQEETSTDDVPPSMRKRRRIESDEEDMFGFIGAVASDPKEPKTFNQAWNSETSEREDWREAIRKELNSMKTRKVWDVVDLDKVPDGRKIIGCKWVFKKKRNGIQRARLVALGFNQVPGIDFSENFAPVIDDATFRLVLTLIQRENLKAYSLDVETAFLHGELEEEIYMKKPRGYEEVFGEKSDMCLRLNKSIYGLVQAARQWWKKFKSEMDEIGFVNSQVDPCLFLKVRDNMKCVLTLYVDDSIIAGDEELIEDTIESLKKVFNIKVQGDLEDYLGCEITRNERGFCISQRRIIEDLVERFKDYLSGREFKTPSSSGYRVIRPDDDSEDCLKNEEQMLYRSAVGSLLYLVKHSRPDLSNSVREFSKVMDRAEQSHWRELLRMVKYVSLSRNKELCLYPDDVDTWILEVFSDSDYSGDKDTRRSVSGYVIYCNGLPIAWRSKGQKSVTLSSTEAEYVAISEAVRELRFVYQVMKSLKIEVKLPIRLNVDNLGAIFLAKNKNASERTKHVDARHHYVRELIENNFLEVVFVPSEENIADIFTKNLDVKGFELFQSKLLDGFDSTLNRKGIKNRVLSQV